MTPTFLDDLHRRLAHPVKTNFALGAPNRKNQDLLDVRARSADEKADLAGVDLTAPGGVSGGLDGTLLAALWRLPSRQREVIALRIFLDLDTGTIARQLGIEAGTVRMHLSRGIAALRRELTPTKTTEAGQ